MTEMSEANLDGVAIIGLTGRFPGAANVDEFWQNLAAGVESIAICFMFSFQNPVHEQRAATSTAE